MKYLKIKLDKVPLWYYYKGTETVLRRCIMRYYLKELRKQHHLTQEQVALKANVSRLCYTRIENGQRQKRMNIVTLQKLAEVFDVPVEQLIAEETKLQSTAS